MLRPSATELMKSKKIDSKYTLVIATAKRAREILSNNGVAFAECDSDKPVSIAVHEIAENKVTLKKAGINVISDTDTIMNDILEHEIIAEKEGWENEDA